MGVYRQSQQHFNWWSVQHKHNQGKQFKKNLKNLSSLVPGLDDKKYKELKRSNDCLTYCSIVVPRLSYMCHVLFRLLQSVSSFFPLPSMIAEFITRRSLFVFLFVFCCSLYCMSFDVRFMITPLAPSNFSSKLELHVNAKNSGFRELTQYSFLK